MALNDEFDDVVMHHVSPESLRSSADNYSMGELHAGNRAKYSRSLKDADSEGNGRKANFYRGLYNQSDSLADSSYRASSITPGVKSSSFKYDTFNISDLN